MDKYGQAKWLVITYFIIIFVTTVIVMFRYPKTDYFWSLMFASVVWVITGALSIWYSWINGKINLSIFFYVIFIGLYWTIIYYTLESKPINIPKFQVYTSYF